MRLAGQIKLGYYPAHRDAVQGICRHLRPDDNRPDMMTMLDPCAGEGRAALEIAHHLDMEANRIYCVELDAGRAAKTRELMPSARVLGPASFMSTRITPGSMSLVYCNPPFDVELGGGKRQEQTFAEDSTRALRSGGVLVLVMPYSAIRHNSDFKDLLDNCFEDARIFRFPEGKDEFGTDRRAFQEIVYFGKKRRAFLDQDGKGYLGRAALGYRDPADVVGTLDYSLTVPSAHAPASFARFELTDPEIAAALLKSPLIRHLAPPNDRKTKRPPCDLGAGHIALLLASGLLDGVIYPPDEPPHVVRGTARKVDYQPAPPEHKTNEKGTVTAIVEVWSQKILLTVRAIDRTGFILTFEDGQGNNALVVRDSS